MMDRVFTPKSRGRDDALFNRRRSSVVEQLIRNQ
jgi:hypothetical protein